MKRAAAAAALAVLFGFARPALSQTVADWFTRLPRTPIHVKAWPGGKRVAVCFVFYVEVWGAGHGPNFRPDNTSRTPDLLNESFRQYAIDEGIPRIGRLFADEGVPLSVALNALFPTTYPSVWKSFRSSVPNAAIVAHGMNNTTQLLPLSGGLPAQEAYVKKTLDAIERSTGKRPRGWSSPSVYPNAQTFSAVASQGIGYTLDAMDSDTLSWLATPASRLMLVPYPTTTVDMGQFLERLKNASDLEKLWTDYVDGLVREARARPDSDATVVAIGLHPFVVGTPDGAQALRRVIDHLKAQDDVWIADTDAVYRAGRPDAR